MDSRRRAVVAVALCLAVLVGALLIARASGPFLFPAKCDRTGRCTGLAEGESMGATS